MPALLAWSRSKPFCSAPRVSSRLSFRARRLHNPRSWFSKSSKSQSIWPSRKFRINFVEIAGECQVSCAVEVDTRRSRDWEIRTRISDASQNKLSGMEGRRCPAGHVSEIFHHTQPGEILGPGIAALGHHGPAQGPSPWRVLGLSHETAVPLGWESPQSLLAPWGPYEHPNSPPSDTAWQGAQHPHWPFRGARSNRAWRSYPAPPLILTSEMRVRETVCLCLSGHLFADHLDDLRE